MSDYDALDRALIDALKLDAETSAAPSAARRAVALRLAASAGVVGLAAPVAAVAHAGASHVAGVALGTKGLVSAPPAVSALVGTTALGLTKTLLVGMGLGASVGLGLHVAFNGAPRSTRHETVTQPAAHAASAAQRSGAARVAPTRGAPVPVAEAPRVDALELATSTPSPRHVEHPHGSAHGGIAVNPAPELPTVPAPALGTQGLAEQQALLDAARAALAHGSGSAAMAALRSHLERFPRTAFEQERELLLIKALLALGRSHEARAQADAFERSFPKSVLLPSLRSLLEHATLAHATFESGVSAPVAAEPSPPESR